MSHLTMTLSKRKSDVDALKMLKKLRNKTIVPNEKKKLIDELTTTPKKMEKIINTWATIRARRPTRLTPEENRTFHRLKNRFIKSRINV